MKFLEMLDFYGKKINLNIKGEESYNTLFGGIISLLIWIGTLSLLWYFGQELWLRQEPKYFSRITYTDNTPWISLNESDFYFLFQVKDNKGRTIDNPRYFTFYAQYLYFQVPHPEKNKNFQLLESKEVPLQRCIKLFDQKIILILHVQNLKT